MAKCLKLTSRTGTSRSLELPRMSELSSASIRISKSSFLINYFNSIVEAELLTKLLDIVAAKHPETKFVKSIATQCVENFRDHDCPALLFYLNNEL